MGHIVNARKDLPKFLVCLAVLVLAIGFLTSYNTWQSNNKEVKKVKKAISEANHGIDNGVPNTVKVTTAEFNSYHVPADNPRYIFIPKIGVKSIILPLGTTTGNQIAVPASIYAAGWYNLSSLPGKSGAMLIYGHVSSWSTPGIFYNLKNLVPGDKIEVEQGNDLLYTYTVVKTVVYNYQNVDMNAVLKPVISGKPGLNLVTCTGSVIESLHEFSQRLVVFASEK
jgi:LPXTG-site transpeptidase (sortase) family protein